MGENFDFSNSVLKMKFKGIVSSALICLLLKGAECSEPWIDLGYLGCFHFAVESEFINWYDAQIYCNELNETAFLAEILDNETQLVLTALADELPDHAWWLGATDFYQVKCMNFVASIGSNYILIGRRMEMDEIRKDNGVFSLGS